MNLIFSFEEEKQPCGSKEFKLLTYSRYNRSPEVPKGTLVQRVATHPWFVVIWEPLTSKAPGPHLTQVWCCYARTVFFYVRPYLVNEFSRYWKDGTGKWRVSTARSFFAWQQLEYVFIHDDIIEFEGEQFIVGGGYVVYYHKRWWMGHSARREKKNLNEHKLAIAESVLKK